MILETFENFTKLLFDTLWRILIDTLWWSFCFVYFYFSTFWYLPPNNICKIVEIDRHILTSFDFLRHTLTNTDWHILTDTFWRTSMTLFDILWHPLTPFDIFWNILRFDELFCVSFLTSFEISYFQQNLLIFLFSFRHILFS